MDFRSENTHRVDTWDELLDVLDNKGGFALAHWDGTMESEDKIKETKATIRCLPLDGEGGTGQMCCERKTLQARELLLPKHIKHTNDT